MKVRLSSILVFGVAFLVFQAGYAYAEDFYFFRIDTEIDVPAYYGSSGPTVRWKCNGTGEGIITDNTASESTQLLDGIVKVASTSIENNSAHAGCNASEAITATVSFDGWVSRVVTGTVSGVGSNITFTTRASMDYTILVNGIADELGTALTLNGTTASATYSGTVASQSYSSGKRYIAATTSGGTITGGGDGYVNRTSSATTISSTASQSVDFGTTDTSSLNESGLLFGHKFTVFPTLRSGEPSDLAGATVTAGDSNSITCTESSAVYYCPVPLGHTGTTAQASKSDYHSATAPYSIRSSGSSSQFVGLIRITQISGGGESSGSVATATPTSTPVPQPTSSPVPTLTPQPTLNLTAKILFRKVNDPKVYVHQNDGTIRWIRTLEEFNQGGYKWQDVKVVSGREFSGIVRMAAGRPAEGKLQVSDDVRVLRVRSGPSLKGKIIGRIFARDVWIFTEVENNWYKIQKGDKDFGWVSGEYILEM